MARNFLLLPFLLISADITDAKHVTVSNLSPKRSIDGSIVNGHDGTYNFWEGYWWYHAAEYGLCREPAKNGCDQTPGPVGPPYPAPGHCGFQANHNVSIWRSPDLSNGSWEFVGRAARCDKDVPNCNILYRPHAVYNSKTKQYVLFVNFVSLTGYGGNAVFTALHPAGPFVLQTRQMALTRLCPSPGIPAGQQCGKAQGGCGDFDVIVDSADNSAYIIYGCNFWMGIERLTDDYLDSAGGLDGNATILGGTFNGTTFPEYFVEAPAFFKRRGLYYALFGHCCCFCYQGSGVMAYTAPSPRGPWQPQCSDVAASNETDCRAPSGDLACVLASTPSFIQGTPTPGQGCNYGGRPEASTVRAQQNFVITVPSPEPDAEPTFIWTGDRWQQSPDGLKGHEGQTWAVLEFDASGRVAPIQWQDDVTFAVTENRNFIV